MSLINEPVHLVLDMFYVNMSLRRCLSLFPNSSLIHLTHL